MCKNTYVFHISDCDYRYRCTDTENIPEILQAEMTSTKRNCSDRFMKAIKCRLRKDLSIHLDVFSLLHVSIYFAVFFSYFSHIDEFNGVGGLRDNLNLYPTMILHFISYFLFVLSHRSNNILSYIDINVKSCSILILICRVAVFMTRM